MRWRRSWYFTPPSIARAERARSVVSITEARTDGTTSAQASWAKRLKTLVIETLNAWIDHRASSKGAALAFYTLFSMAPIVLLAITIASYIFGAQSARSEMAAQLQSVFGENGAQAIVALLKASSDPVSGLVATLVASFLLILGATSVFAELKGSLDEIWGIDNRRQPALITFLKTRLLSFSLVLFLAFLLLLSILVSAGLVIVEGYADRLWGSTAVLFATGAAWLVSFGLTVALFALIYKTLPAAPLSWRDVLIGAVFTAALFSLGKYAIGLYLSNSAIASGFGAAGSLVAVLLWVYYSAQIFFLGAEFTRHYALSLGSLQATKMRDEPPI